MKEAIIVDLNGFYIEPELVPIETYGVTPIYEQPALPEPEEDEELEQEQPEPILVGYLVAVPVPQGLFKLRYDLEAWVSAMTAYTNAFTDWSIAWSVYDPESEDDPPQRPLPVDPQSFWIEGLTPEEIDELLNAPQPETDAQKIARLERDKAALEVRVAASEEVNASTSADLQALMELYFGEEIV